MLIQNTLVKFRHKTSQIARWKCRLDIIFLIDLDTIHIIVWIYVSRVVFRILMVNHFLSTNPYKLSVFERSITCRFFSRIVLIYWQKLRRKVLGCVARQNSRSGNYLKLNSACKKALNKALEERIGGTRWRLWEGKTVEGLWCDCGRNTMILSKEYKEILEGNLRFHCIPQIPSYTLTLSLRLSSDRYFSQSPCRRTRFTGPSAIFF